jgi:hypothetical protein
VLGASHSCTLPARSIRTACMQALSVRKRPLSRLLLPPHDSLGLRLILCALFASASQECHGIALRVAEALADDSSRPISGRKVSGSPVAGSAPKELRPASHRVPLRLPQPNHWALARGAMRWTVRLP